LTESSVDVFGWSRFVMGISIAPGRTLQSDFLDEGLDAIEYHPIC
jgi:hypothetical protein